ncbi:uncharacterized protein LOC111098617 isoform X1 [Canis lupus familiaris]|uniref:uncharacterized protein LOC111098617 isoform X1 n=1 Tax=Canis lupus familiaris TaxID=9615 RepID=UPI000BAA1CBE|nr:uncharacterized protein LOC111098617 isoform X1 [Canis lupus familiaris]XP_038412052.1 uncharacterized protein LOC111098617 isoform X1 [Canis lupus familiaris]XP_038541591.1 uncharacterized protein LOC111098617 isoform X1 [Canis lupus familiaris]|eukprot:XP_022282700.1 uncharacterized protein LOC111098617 isoform X1 [Canis lupus familiaris]
MQEMKRKQLWFRMIRGAIDVTASLEALGWVGGLLTPSWEVLAMCMSVPECAQAAPSEGRREGRDLQRLPEEVVGDTLFLLLLLSLWRPSLDYHSWALASPLFISQGRTDDLADAEFRRGNRGSVTQPFPGGDPSVLLLRAINFIEAGLCREGAARGWLPIDPRRQQEKKKNTQDEIWIVLLLKRRWQGSLWSKTGVATKVPDETLPDACLPLGPSLSWKGHFCQCVLGPLSGTPLPWCSSCLLASRGTELRIILVPGRKGCHCIIPGLLGGQSELPPLLSQTTSCCSAKRDLRWPTTQKGLAKPQRVPRTPPSGFSHQTTPTPSGFSQLGSSVGSHTGSFLLQFEGH